MKPKDTANRCLRKQSVYTSGALGLPAARLNSLATLKTAKKKLINTGQRLQSMQRKVRLDKIVKLITTVLSETSYF